MSQFFQDDEESGMAITFGFKLKYTKLPRYSKQEVFTSFDFKDEYSQEFLEDVLENEHWLNESDAKQ